GQYVLDNVVFEHQSLYFCATLAVGQIVSHNLCGLLVVLRKFFDTRTDLLGLGTKIVAFNQLGHNQAKTHATLGFGRERLGGNRHGVGIGHATLLELFASLCDTVCSVVVHKRLGHIKGAGSSQGFHYACLGAGLGTSLDFALDVGTHVFEQFVDVAFGLTERLGEIAVNLGKNGFGYLIDSDLESRSSAGNCRSAVISRKLEQESLGLAGLEPTNRSFELGQHAARTQNKRKGLCRSAFERDAVDCADKIDRDAVVVLGGTIFARFVSGALFAQNIDRALNFGIANFDVATGD